MLSMLLEKDSVPHCTCRFKLTALKFEYSKSTNWSLLLRGFYWFESQRLTSSIKSINEDEEEEKESYFNENSSKEKKREREREMDDENGLV